MGADKASVVNSTAYRVWNRVKVSKELFDLLIKHPVFKKEPKAINTAQYWLSAIDAAMGQNDDKPVTWFYKDIENRFQGYTQSHTVFRDALRKLGLITYTTHKPPPNLFVKGECRKFTITPLGRKLVSGGNYQWLHNLLNDPQTRRRNTVAVSKRKGTRTVYTEPIKRIIDEFSHTVKFNWEGVLNQLRADKVKFPGTYNSALHHLLSFARRTFAELVVKEGRIYHEFVALPSEYRPFALFKGKPYVATVDIRACHPTFLGKFLREFHQACMDEHRSKSPDPRLMAIAAKLNATMSLPALEKECDRWTDLFTDESTDPRDAIMAEAGICIAKKDMKQCLNTWLNGGKEYQRPTDGRRNRTDNKRLEAWFQTRWPEMAKVWAALGHRDMTGTLITEAYEFPLMTNPALYALADGLGLTLSYEYDGVGVFAERDDSELSSKLKKISSFIQKQSADKFQVPVVVKAEVLTP